MDEASQRRAGVARLFDSLAPVYDQSGVPFFGPIAERLLSLIAPRTGERGADIGCGRGAVTLPLARALGQEGHVTAVDLSASMVELLAARAADLELGPIDTRVGDSAEVGLAPGSYDLVTASLVLFFAPDPLGTLTHWVSLLRPTGRIGITTFGDQDEAWRAVDDVFTPFLPPHLLDPRTTTDDDPFASTDGLHRLFTAAGADDVESHEERLEITFAGADDWRAWTMTTGQRAFWAAVPSDQVDEVLARATTALDRARGIDGRIHLGNVVRYTTATRPYL